jgi:hypothetical protein
VIARPYRKNDQTLIERFNGTLRREESGRTPLKAGDPALAQQRADANSIIIMPGDLIRLWT